MTGNPHPNIGVEFNFSANYGGLFGESFDNYFYRGGLRFAKRTEKITPWAHVLAGGVTTRISGFSDTNFAWAVGGGIDLNTSRRVAVRLIQVDFVGVNFDVSPIGVQDYLNNVRVSVGVVFKW